MKFLGRLFVALLLIGAGYALCHFGILDSVCTKIADGISNWLK